MPETIRQNIESKHLYLSSRFGLENERDVIREFYAIGLEHLILNSTISRFQSLNHTKLMLEAYIKIAPYKGKLSNYEISLTRDLEKEMTWFAKSTVDYILSTKSAPYYKRLAKYGPLHSGKIFRLYSQGVIFELLDIINYLGDKVPNRQSCETEESDRKLNFQKLNHEIDRIARALDSGMLGKFKEYEDINNHLKYVLTGSLNSDIDAKIH